MKKNEKRNKVKTKNRNRNEEQQLKNKFEQPSILIFIVIFATLVAMFAACVAFAIRPSL